MIELLRVNISINRSAKRLNWIVFSVYKKNDEKVFKSQSYSVEYYSWDRGNMEKSAD